MSEPVQVCGLICSHGLCGASDIERESQSDNLKRRSRSDRPTSTSTIRRFNDLTIALTRSFLPVSEIMRLLAEIVIIGALISLGWNKPLKDQVAQASTTITTKLHGIGSKLQKHEDPSVRRY